MNELKALLFDVDGTLADTELDGHRVAFNQAFADAGLDWNWDVAPEKKPAPDIYYYAMEKVGLTAADCLALEDSENGLLSSTGAGIKTLVTVNGYTRQQDFDDAAIVLDKLGEPDAGFTVIAGDAGEATYVDVPFIKRLFV